MTTGPDTPDTAGAPPPDATGAPPPDADASGARFYGLALLLLLGHGQARASEAG